MDHHSASVEEPAGRGSGPLQFSTRLRSRAIRTHRILGRIYVIAVLLGATARAVTTLWNSMGIRGVFGYFMLDVM